MMGLPPFWGDPAANNGFDTTVRDLADDSWRQFEKYFGNSVNIWDLCLIKAPNEPGYRLLPGIAKVKVSKTEKLDVKSAPGSDGATITAKGYEPAKVDIELSLWSRADWIRLSQVLPIIEPKPRKGVRQPLQILNPVTQTRGVKSIIVETVSGPDLQGDIGKMSIKAIEWMPQPTATGSATATTTPQGKISVTLDDRLPGSGSVVAPIGEGSVSPAVAAIFNTNKDRAKP